MDKEDIASQNDAAACGKLWDIYSREAQAYDEGLIKSWKEDMDIILVFSGLYSAILTAFVIESYQNLQPDKAEKTAVLLERISQQLAAPLNSSSLTPFPDDEAFSPTSSALSCNILWFISLALALTCAFLAMMVQQWSRRFLRRTSAVRSPSAHAHLLQYLYFGLKDMKMHAIVDLIPSLLHLSLFSFFAGLIGFLHDVDTILTWLFALFLGLILLVYSTFTVLPVLNLSSPYATPLSPVLWRIWRLIRSYHCSLSIQAVQRFLFKLKPGTQIFHPKGPGTRRPPNDEEARPLFSVTEKYTRLDIKPHQKGKKWSLVDASIQESQKRCHTRESRSITWTLGALSDDTELLYFLEALPDVLLGSDFNQVREGNLHLTECLLATRDAQSNIISRTLSLMESANNPWHTNQHRQRCSIACAKTLYSLARVLVDQKYRARFVSSAIYSSLFSGKTLMRIMTGIESGTLEPSFSKSALVLCGLSILQLPSDHNKARSWLAIMSMPPNSWESSVVVRKFPTQLQPEVAMQEMMSSLFYRYLCDAVHKSPFNLFNVCDLMVGNGVHHLLASNPTVNLRFLFSELSRSIQGSNECTSVKRTDGIFGLALDCVTSATSAQGLANDSEHDVILNYITGRFNGGGWGSTAEIWSIPGRLPKLLTYFQKPETSLFNVPNIPSSALQELLLHTVKMKIFDIQSFLKYSFFHIQTQPREKNTPKSHLWFFLVLVILKHFHWRDKGSLFSILDQVDQELHQDPRSNNIFTRPHIEDERAPQLTVLLHSLNCELSLQHTRDILQFFFYCFPSGLFTFRDVMRLPNLVNELVKHSENFATLILQAPSKEAIDVAALIWSLWRDVLPWSSPSIDNAEAQATWSKVAPLSNLANKLLASKNSENMQHDIAESTPKLHHTVLTDSNLKRLDLFNSAELVQKRLAPVIHLLIPLPLADPNEEF